MHFPRSRGSKVCRAAFGPGAWLLALLAATVACAAPASNLPPGALGDLSLEQLMEIRIERVFSASKYDQKVTRAPAAVTILSAEEIEKFGHRTLADVLRSMRGVYVTSDRNYANLGMRGFARPGDFNTRVLLLVDGHRMNDNLYSSALVGPEAVTDIGLVERVEVIRGPSSSIYGNSAFFGVINIVTRKGREIDGLELAAEAGSLDARKARVTYGKLFRNGVEVVVSASSSDSAGHERLYYPELDTPGNNDGVAVNSDSERTNSFHGRVTWRDFTFAAGHSLREKQVPTGSFGTAFNDGREVTTDIRTFANLKFTRQLANGLELSSRAYYDYYSYLADYPYNYAGRGRARMVVISQDDTHGEGVGADVQLTKRIGNRHTLVFGGEHRRDLSLLQSNHNADGSTNFSSDYTGHSTGLFLQDEIALRDDVILNAGLRYDSFSNFGGKLSPRVALIYTPGPKSAVKLLYGDAYRAPNAYESYLDSPGYNKANLTLEPETIRTLEAVYEHYLPKNHRFGVSAYFYDLDDLIGQKLDPADGEFVFRNGSSIHAHGAELELEGRYAGGLLVRGSYAWQRAVYQDSNDEIDNSPRHLARLNALLPLFRDRLHAGVEVQHHGSVNTLGGARASAFTVVNATLTGRVLAEGLTVSASLYNLFDREYGYPGSTGHRQDLIPQDGRSFRVQLTYKF